MTANVEGVFYWEPEAPADYNGGYKLGCFDNGDPTSLMPFQNPEMNLFSGAATAIVRSGTDSGTVSLTASAKGVKPASISIPVE